MKVNFFIITLFLISLSSVCDDANQYLGGQFPTSESPYEKEEEVEKNDEDLSNYYENSKISGSSFLIPESVEKSETIERQEDELRNYGQGFSGDGERQAFTENKNVELLNRYQNKAKKSFSFRVYMDDLDVSGDGGIFDSTFERGPEVKGGQTLLFSSSQYIHRGLFNFSWGANFGFGYRQGTGIFKPLTSSDPEERSDTIFKFWTIPLDLSLGLELPILWGYFKLGVSGGPSVLGLWQNRNDFEKGEAKKNRRQVGFGYFLEGRLQLSLARLFKKSHFSLFSGDKVSNFFLNLEIRQQNYVKFQDPIEISGLSYGLSVSFEYL